MIDRLLPVPDEISAPYWSACARHELALSRCEHCGKFSFPPDDICPVCHNIEPRFTFMKVSGRGKVRTWTVMRRSFLRGFDVPFLLVDVQLDDQPNVRLIGRLLDGPETKLQLGARVSVAFEDLAPGVAVPAFKLDHAA